MIIGCAAMNCLFLEVYALVWSLINTLKTMTITTTTQTYVHH